MMLICRHDHVAVFFQKTLDTFMKRMLQFIMLNQINKHYLKRSLETEESY